jgi:hypothetical protein
VLLIVVAIALVGIFAGINLYDEKALDPFSRLFEAMVINKASSASGMERAYWNWQSLQSLVDTVGLGIGIGSSRASSWIIAVISQLGILGAFVVGLLTLVIVRGPGGACREEDFPLRAVTNSVRAACLAGLLTASVSGAEANPGLLFCVALAVTISFRQLARVDGVSRPYGRLSYAFTDAPFRPGDGPVISAPQLR